MGFENSGSKNYKNQEDTFLTKSTKNPKKSLIFYTNSDAMINKRNGIQSWVSTNNPDSFSSIIRQKGESQNGCFEKTKHAKFFEKRTFLTP